MVNKRNVFACLVHENQDCVVDLVRNLRFLDSSSMVLLYNGGPNSELLSRSPGLKEHDAIIHPSSSPMSWGRLHGFALDCMQFALDQLEFDTLTIVDSDQLMIRPSYSDYISAFLQSRDRIGLLGSAAGILPRNTLIGPVQAAYQEFALWMPFLRRFTQGEQNFAHWSFWPSTIFTHDAAREVVRFFRSDAQLQAILQRTRIWATEEVILPTLTALLGFEVVANPCSYDFVKYRARYAPVELDGAFCRQDVFWVHPIPRHYDDPLRCQVRERFDLYQNHASSVRSSHSGSNDGLVLSVPILRSMKRIHGWLEEDEADLLIATASRALNALPSGCAVVEIGSFCGRSTVVLGSVVKALGSDTRVYAIDPHDGKVGAADRELQFFPHTRDVFDRNIAENALSHVIETIPERSFEVTWQKPIGYLLIDGLHDYANVARDFRHFEKWIVPGGCVAFHDYADYYPGVKIFVNEVLAGGQYERVRLVNSMIVLKKITEGQQATVAQPKDKVADQQTTSVSDHVTASSASEVTMPLVSCIIPTADRRSLIPQAIRHFLRQDYFNRELIIVDDGTDNIADLVPVDARIRYVRLPQRQTMGTKHNIACELAQGEIIVHWDDDDWMAHWRLSYQVKELLQSPPATLCGLSHLLFYDPHHDRAWQYIYPAEGRPWVSGATFCYRKSFWQQHRFPDMNEGADTVFVWELKDAKVVPLQDHTFYIATVHSQNTSRKHTESHGWHPLPSQEIRQLLDEQDWQFYRDFALGRSVALQNNLESLRREDLKVVLQ